MIKNFKFAGVALLVVGLTFAASSCQKQDFIEDQNENQVATVDFSELTKAVEDDIDSEDANADAAIESLIAHIEKQLGVAAIAHKEAIQELSSYLRKTFRSQFHAEYDFSINKEFFKSAFSIIVNFDNNRREVILTRGHYEGEMYRHLRMESSLLALDEKYIANDYQYLMDNYGYLKLTTKDGYYLEIMLPYMYVAFVDAVEPVYYKDIQTSEYIYQALAERKEKISNSGIFAEVVDPWFFYIGKEDTVFAGSMLDTYRTSAFSSWIYDHNQNIVAGTNGTYKNHFIGNITSFNFWYDNSPSADYDFTSFKIWDFAKVSNALLNMSLGYFAGEEEIKEAYMIANEFNTYFKYASQYFDATYDPALLAGKELLASVVLGKTPRGADAEIYLMWGDSRVDPIDVYDFLVAYFKKVIEEQTGKKTAEDTTTQEVVEPAERK